MQHILARWLLSKVALYTWKIWENHVRWGPPTCTNWVCSVLTSIFTKHIWRKEHFHGCFIRQWCPKKAGKCSETKVCHHFDHILDMRSQSNVDTPTSNDLSMAVFSTRTKLGHEGAMQKQYYNWVSSLLDLHGDPYLYNYSYHLMAVEQEVKLKWYFPGCRGSLPVVRGKAWTVWQLNCMVGNEGLCLVIRRTGINCCLTSGPMNR